MDEILFENRYACDDEAELEAVRRVTLGDLFRGEPWRTIAFFAIAAVALLLHLKVPFLVMLVLACVSVLSELFLPRICLCAMKKEALRLNGGRMPESVVQFGECILLKEGALNLATEYEQIIEIRRLKHSVVLMTGANTGIELRPDAFTLGTCEDCLAFLEEKCPNLGNPSAVCGNILTRKRRIVRTVGSVMLGAEIGVFYGLSLTGISISLTPIVCAAAVVWLAVSVFLMIASKSIFK